MHTEHPNTKRKPYESQYVYETQSTHEHKLDRGAVTYGSWPNYGVGTKYSGIDCTARPAQQDSAPKPAALGTQLLVVHEKNKS